MKKIRLSKNEVYNYVYIQQGEREKNFQSTKRASWLLSLGHLPNRCVNKLCGAIFSLY